MLPSPFCLLQSLYLYLYLYLSHRSSILQFFAVGTAPDHLLQMTKPNSVPYLISFLLLLIFNFSYLIHASPAPAAAAHTISRDQITCTMCAACDNPCQPILSPPPPSPPSPPPPSPPVPVQPECPPPPNSNTPYYYSSPPPPPSIPKFMYYSPPPPSTTGGYYPAGGNPPPAAGGYYPAGGNPPPPNPIVPYFPYYYYTPPGDYNSNSGSPPLQKIKMVAFSVILTTLFFLLHHDPLTTT